MKTSIYPKSFRFNEMDLEIIKEWKKHLGYDCDIDIIRYALRQLRIKIQPKPRNLDGVDIVYD